jgi:hypothetical protein
MKKQMVSACAAVVALLAGTPAVAEVKASAPDGMRLEFKGEVALTRDAAWRRLVALGAWWNGSHSYSGDAANMKIDPVAGGCWCEVWAGGSVEHGRVILAQPGETLRFSAALGPLQDLGVHAVMTFSFAEGKTADTTAVTMTLNAVGSSLSGLDKMAAPVDGVMKEQFDRFIAGK